MSEIKVVKSASKAEQYMRMPIEALDEAYLDMVEKRGNLASKMSGYMSQVIDEAFKKFEEDYADEIKEQNDVRDELIICEKILEARIMTGEKSKVFDIDEIRHNEYDCYDDDDKDYYDDNDDFDDDVDDE